MIGIWILLNWPNNQ